MNIQPNSAPSRMTVAPQSAPSQPAAAREAAEQKPAPVDASTAVQVVRQINDFLKSSSANLEFQVDEESNQVVVRVVDTETKKLIRQIPSEEMLAISRNLDQLRGLLLNQKA